MHARSLGRAVGPNTRRQWHKRRKWAQGQRCLSKAAADGQKPQVVVLGAGWAGFPFARDLAASKFNITLVSPRNHFLFTPLLPSTTTGTLEFRCIQEPVRTLQGVKYYQADCTGVDFQGKSITCTEIYKGADFKLKYDILVIAAGSHTNTFGVPGVSEEHNVFFLKQLGHARAIRNRMIECFERASSPLVGPEERDRLLSFVVVGGGPTSIEFAAELHDFIQEDVRKWYPDLYGKATITLVEASDHILGPFDDSLVKWVTHLFQNRNIRLLLKTSVKEVHCQSAVLADGTKLPFGTMVWSTGVTPVPLISTLQLPKGQGGRILVDEFLRVAATQGAEGVFVMGDCAVNKNLPLAPLAQVAQQQGKYLARQLNKHGNRPELWSPFHFTNMGSMAQVGEWKGVVDLSQTGIVKKDGKPKGHLGLEGFLAFITWRSAYWTKTVSLANKMLIPMYWFKSWAFGRDISKF